MSGTTCSGAQCVATACSTGYTLCDGSCTTCPAGGGIATTGCVGGRCEATSCDSGYELCAGSCSACPATGVTATGCNGAQCVATACAAGFRPCATGCCAWRLADITSSGSIANHYDGPYIATAFDSLDTLHIAWFRPATGKVEYRQGSTAAWHFRDLGTAYDSSVGMVLVNDQPNVITHDRVNSTTSQILHHARSSAGTWTSVVAYQATASPYLMSGQPAIAADASGNLTVLYWDTNSSGANLLYALTRTSTGSTWSRQNTGLTATYALLIRSAGINSLVGTPMTESAPGVYTGVYTASSGSDFSGAEVLVQVMDRYGNQNQAIAAGKVSVSRFRPPVAVITGPAEVRVNQTHRWSGSSSTAPEGRIIAYEWDMGDGTRYSTRDV
ncbi:MAG: PKD domain-containing protein, partial [Myxococcales bacterium]